MRVYVYVKYRGADVCVCVYVGEGVLFNRDIV